MASWLTPAQAAGLVESSVVDPATDTAWVGDVDAACVWVERQRKDLFDAAEPPVFVADAAIKLGTAMLASRWHARRTSPLGSAGNAEFGAAELMRHDPDIAKLLGVGQDGAFTFGAPTRPAPGVVV